MEQEIIHKKAEKMKRNYKSMVINKDFIDSYIVKPIWQRNLYPARVNYFVTQIKSGKFMKSLVTVAKDKDKFVLLDGQHKLEAIKLTGQSLEMDFLIYEDVTKDEMIALYKMLNDVKAPRVIDDLKLYLGRNSWVDAFLEEKYYPILITLNGGVNSMRLDKLLNVMHNGFMTAISRHNLSRKKLPIYLETIDSEKYGTMREFCELHRKCFGVPSNDNWMYKNIVMFTLMRIWLKNKDKIPEKDFVKCFREVETDASIRQDSDVTSISGLEGMTRKIYRVINKHRSVNKFEPFWEE